MRENELLGRIASTGRPCPTCDATGESVVAIWDGANAATTSQPDRLGCLDCGEVMAWPGTE